MSLFVFLDKGFKFQTALCSSCHDVVMMSMKLNNIAILNIHGFDYHCIVNGMSKKGVVNILKKADLSKKLDYYKI